MRFSINISHILFDWDGVLAHRVEPFVPIWDEFHLRFGVPVETTKKALERVMTDYQLGSIDNITFWQTVARRLGLEPNFDMFNQLFFTERIINQELMSTIERMRLNYRVGVVSNNFDLMRDRIMSQFGDRLDFWIFSCDIGHVKPSRELFEIISMREHININSMVIIDDDPVNLAALHAVGAHTIHYKWNVQNNETLFNTFVQLGILF